MYSTLTKTLAIGFVLTSLCSLSAQEGTTEPRLGTQADSEQRDSGTQGEDGVGVGLTTVEVLASAVPAASDAWRRMLAASQTKADGSPIEGADEMPPPQSFHLEANVRTREGVKTNELNVDYRFLSPDFVRFRLPSNRQSGHGPGKGNSAYWLMDGEEVQLLDTRDNKEDRRLVKEMIALARNFLALADPDRIRLTRLELLSGSPVLLPRQVSSFIKNEARDAKRAARKEGGEDSKGVVWIRFTSPDFDLVRRDGVARDTTREQLVSLAIGPQGLPLAAVIQEPGSMGQALQADATLISLDRWVRKIDDPLLAPRLIKVFRPEQSAGTATGGQSSLVFGQEPMQHIALTTANLHPNFVPTDFAPK